MPQFILWGNIYDRYPCTVGGPEVLPGLSEYLRRILSFAGYPLILQYEPLLGFTLLHDQNNRAKELTELPFETVGQVQATSLERAAGVVESLSKRDTPAAVILHMASRLSSLCPQEIETFQYRIFRQLLAASPKAAFRMAPPDTNAPAFPVQSPQVIWVLEKENDLPPWYSLDNPKLRVLPVSKPDLHVRRQVVNMIAPSFAGYDPDNTNETKEKTELFLDQTAGLFSSEIIAIASLATRERLAFSQVAEAIRRYKIGVSDNPWDKLDKEKIREAEAFLASRVMGQDDAVRHSVDIIKRSIFNLSGAQFSRLSQKPKGVLFLAGPTGVGKTELAKSITELVFGSPTNYIRFDMSEFAHEHADQRLVGAPPGYVGYDVGGQLTNAIKQSPFSLVLFDEIEKGHPRILDMFLQLLDDGRLTSGRGETVYFSEALIVFTTNLGVSEDTPEGGKRTLIDPSMSYEQLRGLVIHSIESFFKSRINRPEILNRLGKNIIVFDFIRDATAAKIFDRMLTNVRYKLEDEHKITLQITDAAKKALLEASCRDLSMGGRGIGNALEEMFVNPLSRQLFDTNARKGSNFTVEMDAGGFFLRGV